VVCLIPLAVVLREHGHDRALTNLLEHAAVWLCDRNERGQLGLAAVGDSREEEIARLLGSSIGLGLEPRHSSLIATVLLDLCALLDLRELYADIRNDLLAVRLHCPVLLTGADSERLVKPAFDARWDFDADYADELTDTPVSPHLADGRDAEDERWWELLVASAVLRDRWFNGAIRAALAQGRTTTD
jgi:hypothetical protein